MADTFEDANKLFEFQINGVIDTDHSVVAVHPVTGDAAVIFSAIGPPRTVSLQIYKRISAFGAPVPKWAPGQSFLLGDGTANVYGADSCENQWITHIDDGFACFWLRRDPAIGSTNMTIGVSLEMAKIEDNGEGGYRKHASATAGKGYVLDDQIINGDCGVIPRCCNASGNIVGVVYTHQTVYNLNTGVHEREYDLRGAYVDFSPSGKPTIPSGGNRTGGSVSDAVDGGFPAGSSTFLPSANGIKIYDEVANEVFANSGGCGLPTCAMDHHGNFLVAYEVRTTGTGTGGIPVRMYKGVGRGNGLNDAPVDSSTSDHAASSGFAARRPILSAIDIADGGSVIASGNYPSVLLAYGDQDPTGAVPPVSIMKTITYPVGSLVQIVAAITVPPNTNYDGTADSQTFAYAVKSPFLNCVVVEENMSGTSGVEGKKYSIVHEAGSVVEVMQFSTLPKCHRANVRAVRLADGARVVFWAWEGTNVAGDSEGRLSAWQF